MIKNISSFIILLLLSFNLQGKELPIEDFFKSRVMDNVKISPDAKHYAFTVMRDGQHFLTIMNRKTGKAHGYEYGTDIRILDFHWVNEERLIAQVAKVVGFLDRKGGPPTLYGINVDGSQRKILFGRENRSQIRILSLLPNDDSKILVAKYHFGDRGIGKLNTLNVYNGKLDYLADQPKGGFNSVIVNNNGEARVAFRYEEKEDDKLGEGKTSLFYKRPNESEWLDLELKGFTPSNTINPLAVSNDNKYAYFTSDIETPTNALFKISLSSGKHDRIFENDVVDLGAPIFSSDRDLIGIRYDENFSRIKFLDNKHPATNLYKSLYASFPDSNVFLTSSSKNQNFSVIYVNSDTNPGEYLLFDKKAKKISPIGKSMPWINSKEMAYMDPIEFTTRDGLKIHGYLTLPKNSNGKNLPLIVNPHGGPHGPRDNWAFIPEVQYLANKGYAVLQVNFRGSGGYGKEFEEKGYRQWMQAMQDDVTDATLWAIKEGIADKERICIYGGSYGGFATLAGVVREPDLYKCGLGYVGVYDLPYMKKYGDIPKRKSGRKYLDRVLGVNQDELIANSPARHVDRIKADLFIAHGSDDVRVPMEQFEILKENLDAIGKPFKSMVKDEGHGYQKFENRIEFYTEMAKFFSKNIGK